MYMPLHFSFFIFFSFVLLLIVLLLYLEVVGAAFKALFPTLGTTGVLLLLVACFIGSCINIPFMWVKTKRPIIRIRYIRFLGIVYPIPDLKIETEKTLIAINFGGAIIPTVASFYLLIRTPSNIYFAFISTMVVTAVMKFVSKPMPGVGIVSPTLVAPLAASLVSIGIGSPQPHVVAYVSGTLGALIGADLLNIKIIPTLGSPIVSIGGAGTFDGIFLSGVIAVLLAT
jgi:uncharacterized membrane protein